MAIVACGASAGSGTDNSGSTKGASTLGGSNSSSGSSGGSSPGGSSSSGSNGSNSSSSGGQGTSSGSPGGSGDDSGTGDDGGASTSSSSGASSSGGSSGGIGSSASCAGFAGYIRGAAPTTASSGAKTGDYTVMSYAANASVRATNAYDVTMAHIYYPVGATPPFAGVAIVPGFTAEESSIANWAPFLASRGIIVMTIGTSNPSTGAADTSVAPNVREAALLDALTTIKGENTRSGSPLVGKVDVNRMATAGWSMGGGGTMLAANSTPSLKASMAMCPWNPGGTYPMMTVPSLQFGGTNDGLAGAPMPDDQYNSIPMTTAKLLYVIQGGSHFVANDPAGEGDPGEVSYAIGRIGLSWMKVFLECDNRYRQFLTVKPTDASEFTTTLM